MAKKTDVNDEEKDTFREAMRGVKPLLNTKITPPVIKQRAKRPALLEDQANEPYFTFSDYEKCGPVSGEDLIHFSRPGLQHKILRNLRRGQYNAEATLDLHGMTTDEAKDLLSQFLEDCLKQGIRHVLVIHGKGRPNSKPILKNKLNHWLRQTDVVLAFSSAIIRHGSGGALYVLLRRNRVEK